MRSKTTNKSHQTGFTLIEILMVVSIIALLASIVTFGLVRARRKANDVRRVSDIQQINNAIQLYVDDNGHAPYSPCSLKEIDLRCSLTDADWGNLITELEPYIASLPKDPCGIKCNVNDIKFNYAYFSPSYAKAYCQSTKCGETNLESSYSIYATSMELQAPFGYFYGVFQIIADGGPPPNPDPTAPIFPINYTVNSPSVQKERGLSLDYGLVVDGMTAAVEKAGMQINDVIVSVDGYSVNSTEELDKFLSQKKAGDLVTINFFHDANEAKIEISL